MWGRRGGLGLLAGYAREGTSAAVRMTVGRACAPAQESKRFCSAQLQLLQIVSYSEMKYLVQLIA